MLKDLIFDGLIKVDEKLQVGPNLALSWDHSRDGLYWRFYLRKNIRFHDGVELTAKDVKFTLDSILDQKNHSPYLNLLDGIRRVDVKEKNQVEIELKYPMASLIFYLDVGILPKHLFAGKDIANNEYNYHPVGSGPFKFSTRSEKEIVLKRNEHHFLGKPYLEGIVVKTFGNQSIVWAQLMKKNLDLVFLGSPRGYGIIERIPDYRVHSPLSLYSYILAFNNGENHLEMRKVRQALNYAVNKEKILEKVLLERGLISSGTICPLSWAHNPNVKPYPYDPKKALELFTSAGWMDSDGNHILDRNGVEFEFTISIVKGDNVSWKTALHVQQQLLDIGIMAKVKPLSFHTFEKSLLTGRFDAALLSIISDDPDKNYAWWHSSQINGGFNVFSYKNKKVDELLDRGRVTLDVEKRKKIYHQFQREIHEDPPGIFLFWRDYLIGMHKRFRGVKVSPAGIFSNVNEWYVPREEQKYR
ncbi:MAG: hypothetical protein JSW70_02890 [Syntrophobacterales bacterium]|nr:MAG: hypothetical protein JSW70_02890 [Syntrophobacterales bacterium]